MSKFIVCIALCLFGASVYASEDHKSHDDKTSTLKTNGKEHANEDSHSENEDHGHEEKESENESIGPGKGIVSADEENGFQISPQAEKNFEIARMKIASFDQIKIPKSAIVTAGVETNIYRFRNGHYKRIDFDVIKKTDGEFLIRSKDLKTNDEIVINGTGLLRISELAAFGGTPEGHSH